MRFSKKALRLLFEEHSSKLHAVPTEKDVELIYARWQNGVPFMDRLNTLLEAHGIETIRDKNGDTAARYINMGDAYILTVVYDYKDDIYRVESWGDWVERQPEGRIP